MSNFILWCRDLFFRKRTECETEEELRFHLAMQEQENLAAGMNREEARRVALLELGGVEQIKEQLRQQRAGFRLETILKDAAFGLRMLRKAPVLTFVCIATLALATGGSTALFSVLNGVVLRPLPYPHSEQLVEIVDTNREKAIQRIGVNARNVEDWRERASLVNGVAAYYTMGRTLSFRNESEVALVSQVSADFFPVFQTAPQLGRVFTEDECVRTRYNSALGLMSPDPVAILSYRLWSGRFGSDRSIIGKKITLDRRAWTVVGVMPPHFAVPDSKTAIWIPWGLRHDSARDQHFAGGVARLAPGVSLLAAQAELNKVADQLGREFPETNAGWNVRMQPLRQTIAGPYERILWFIFSAVAIVMIIACLNIAILQISKASSRKRECAIRLSLGASRGRLFRQFFVESSLMAVAGALFGLLVAYYAIGLLQYLPFELPRVQEVRMDVGVLLLTITLTVVAAVVLGAAPALVAARKTNLNIGAENSRATSGASTQRLRNVLVIAEVALAVTLLASSGMLIRSLLRLQQVNNGFDASNVLVVPVFLDSEKYDSGAKSRAYYRELLERLQKLPGVVSAGGATALPASPLGPDFERPVWAQEVSPLEGNKRHADVRMATNDYFRTLGISVLQGRAFTKQDNAESPRVVILNNVLARQIWGSNNAIGRKLVVDYSTAGTYAYEVVGVVNDIRFYGPRSAPRPEIYLAHAQRPYLILNVAIRTANDPRLLIGPVREVLRTIDPQKPAHSITRLQDLTDARVVHDRYATLLVSCFGFVAVMLASLGIYGVLTFFVRQKTQEIGIRLALGARRHEIARWITMQGARLMVAGLVTGIVAALALSRLLSGILFEVSQRDLFSLTAAGVIILLITLLSGWIPSLRASRIDPCIALRYE